jgi:hypothetical protein
MRGQPFSFEGRHYRVQPTDFFVPPPPVQRPRVPVWVVGASPSRKSLRRAASWDGLIPNLVAEEGVRGPASPEELRPVVEEVDAIRRELNFTGHFDVVAEGTTAANDPHSARGEVAQWSDAGATWWIESDWTLGPDAEGRAKLNERIEAGPPKRGR